MILKKCHVLPHMSAHKTLLTGSLPRSPSPKKRRQQPVSHCRGACPVERTSAVSVHSSLPLRPACLVARASASADSGVASDVSAHSSLPLCPACSVARASASANPGAAHDVSAHGSLPLQTEQQDCALDDDRDDRSCYCREGA